MPEMTTWENEWYVVIGEVTIEQRATVSGDVHLILMGGCALTVQGGIKVSDGNSLTIYSGVCGEEPEGTLTAAASGYRSGIGGEAYGGTAGTITINGGTITASSDAGAGIGGGCNVQGNGGGGGTVTINGGTVTAAGGEGSAGIGGGGTSKNSGGYAGGTGANVTINGGTVTATGGVGIGGGLGYYNGGSGSFQTGANSSVHVTATSISDQSHKSQWHGIIQIGKGYYVGGAQTVPGDLEIQADETLTVMKGGSLNVGGTLTNNGAIAASGGITANSVVNNGTIFVDFPGSVPEGTGGTVIYAKDVPYLDSDGQKKNVPEEEGLSLMTASMTQWRDGWYFVYEDMTIDERVDVTGDVKLILAEGCTLTTSNGIHVGRENSLTIYGQTETGGKLIAKGGAFQAGIGGNETERVGTITIHSGEIHASGGDFGPGIGCGGANTGRPGSGGTVNIYGGAVYASGGRCSAGIGGGGGRVDGGGGAKVTITGGTVTATGGIGGGSSAVFNYSGGPGTFSTGEDGNALIMASIGDSGDKTGWSGIIIEGNAGTVYGGSDGNVTLNTDLEISEGKSLTVPEGVTLTIADGKTLTINGGTVTNYGTIIGNVINNGVILNAGTINGTVTNNGRITNCDTITGTLTNDGTIYQGDDATLPKNVSGDGKIIQGVLLFGDLIVTGGKCGKDFIYEDHTLTILTDTPPHHLRQNQRRQNRGAGRERQRYHRGSVY